MRIKLVGQRRWDSLCHLITVSLLCPSLGAGEEKRKGEEVHCPVCRATWPYTTPITSPSSGPSIMPVSIPVGICGHGSGEGGMLGGMRLKSVSPAYLSQVLSAEKSQLVEKLKSVGVWLNNSCLPWFPSVSPSSPLSPLVSLRLPWFPSVSPGLPLSPLVSLCLPWFPSISPGFPPSPLVSLRLP